MGGFDQTISPPAKAWCNHLKNRREYLACVTSPLLLCLLAGRTDRLSVFLNGKWIYLRIVTTSEIISPRERNVSVNSIYKISICPGRVKVSDDTQGEVTWNHLPSTSSPSRSSLCSLVSEGCQHEQYFAWPFLSLVFKCWEHKVHGSCPLGCVILLVRTSISF